MDHARVTGADVVGGSRAGDSIAGNIGYGGDFRREDSASSLNGASPDKGQKNKTGSNRMSHQHVQAGAAWTWITRGWNTFVGSPGLWIVIALIFAVIYFVLSWLPVIGGLAAAVLGPALFGGMLHGARELEAGRTLDVAHLFQAFRSSGKAGPMLMLGLVPLAASIVTALVAALIVGGAIGTATTGEGGPGGGMLAGGGIALVVIMVAVGLITGALLLFSIPRVMFGMATPGEAVRQSALAVRDSIGAYLVLAGLYIILAIVAMIPFGLGFLVLIPVMAGAVLAAHRQVFGDEQEATASTE